MIGESRSENLSFCFEPAKGARMHDAVAIACVLAAVGMRWFGKSPAATFFDQHGPRCESAARFDKPGLREKFPKKTALGFRGEQFETPVGLIRHWGVRIIFLQLLVNGAGLLGVGLAEYASHFEQDHRLGHQNGARGGKCL